MGWFGRNESEDDVDKHAKKIELKKVEKSKEEEEEDEEGEDEEEEDDEEEDTLIYFKRELKNLTTRQLLRLLVIMAFEKEYGDLINDYEEMIDLAKEDRGDD